MPRKANLEQGITITSKFNEKSTLYYEMLIQIFDGTTNNRDIRCKITEKGGTGPTPREEVFKGKFRRKLDDTRIVAILREVEFGNAQLRLVINASETHANKDRIRVSPSLSDVFDNVEKFGSIQVPMAGGTPDDPDAESFQRVTPTANAPLGAGASSTGNVPGRVQQGTVIVKTSTGVPYAYDDPTQSPNLRLYLGGGAFGSVVYSSGGNWNVTSTDTTFPGGVVESLAF